jgi:pimeloyl-ACP methyl ester carboxylesterase
LRPANYLRLLRLFRAGATDRDIETAILEMTARCVADPVAVIGQWLQWRRENPVSRRNALVQLVAAARYRAPRRSPIKRVLLLAGAADTLVDARCSLRLAAQWDTAVVVHPEAGHDLPLDDAAWVLARITCWLEGPGRAG